MLAKEAGKIKKKENKERKSGDKLEWQVGALGGVG